MKRLNQRGMIGPIEVVLLLVLAGIIGFTGWRLYDANKDSEESTTTSQTATNTSEDANSDTDVEEDADTETPPVSTDKTYTTRYEKLKFTYPKGFTLKDTSYTITSVDPGTDRVELKKGNITLSIVAGITGIGGSCTDCAVLDSEKITLFNHTFYLNYTRGYKGNVVEAIELAKTTTCSYICSYDSKNVVTSWGNSSDGEPAGVLVTIGLTKPLKLAAALKDPDVTAAVDIIKSLHY